MESGIKVYPCNIIGKDVVAERTRSLVGGVIVKCKYYSSSLNTYSKKFNLACSFNFPFNQGCLIRQIVKKEAEEKSRLVRESKSV